MFPVSLNNFHFEDWQFTFNLAAGISRSDEGKAVSLDSTSPNTVKLAGDGDEIAGRLEIVEDRVQSGLLVGTVAIKFGGKLPISALATGTAEVVAGSKLIGAGAGEVKAIVSPTGTERVTAWDVNGTDAVALAL